MSELRRNEGGRPTMTLSIREAEVARLLADDLSDKLIGDILGISHRTVQEYIDRIAKKIGAKKGRRSRRRVIARWIQHKDAA